MYKFAEVILPLPIKGTFTYEVLPEHELDIGFRVAVQFGQRKIYTGIVHSLHNQKPELYKTKPIYSVLDKKPLVLSSQLEFWDWIADYYMCSLGDVYKNTFPTALKLESSTFIKAVQGKLFPEGENLSDEAYLIWEAIQNKSLISVQEASEIIDKKTAISTLKELLDFDLISLDEKIIQKYTPKIENYIRTKLNDDNTDLSDAFAALERAPKQRELFLHLIHQEKSSEKEIKSATFLKQFGGNHSTLRALESKGLIEIYQSQTDRITTSDNEVQKIKQLTEYQSIALNEINKQFDDSPFVLLHGVTSSGKTEIYIKLIEEQINNGKNTLYLLPEISLTTQLMQRIQKHFGNDVGIYHSKFNQNERVELWKKVLNNDYKVIIGARSSLFLPIQNLGLIIIDEEHETSLKQTESKPYYHARDAALYLARKENAIVVLGSATPSLEMYHLAKSERIGYVELTKKYGKAISPEMEIVDLRKAYKQKRMDGNISFDLKEQISATHKNQKQTIIFQNRRGYAPILECKTCGHTPYCPNCDVALTYHRLSNQLKCHYCGHAQAKPNKCYVCQSPELNTKGIGTEQIEEELNRIFPDLLTARMDVDSMRKKFAFEKLIDAFEKKEVDLIVGTQMVTKGLDFEDVVLVGIIRADSLLNFPDFRAYERAFQRIVQVAGRAGRRKQRGKVIIQTFDAEHEILQRAIMYDYHGMAKEQLIERKQFLYPPFVRIIEINFSHTNYEKVEKTAQYFKKLVAPYFDEKTFLGPEPALIPRINNQYKFNCLIKIESDKSPKKVKDLLLKAEEKLNEFSAFRAVRINFNVDS